MIETERAFLKEEMEMLVQDVIVFAEHPLRQIPEILDAIAAIASLAKEDLPVINPAMLEPRYIENVIAGQAVSIDRDHNLAG